MINRHSLKSLNRDSLYMHTARDPLHGPTRAVLFAPQAGRTHHGDSGNDPLFSSPLRLCRSHRLGRPANGQRRLVGPEASS